MKRQKEVKRDEETQYCQMEEKRDQELRIKKKQGIKKSEEERGNKKENKEKEMTEMKGREGVIDEKKGEETKYSQMDETHDRELRKKKKRE